MERVTPVRVAPYALSIVIPAYNEAERLPRSLGLIRAFLRAQGWEATTEVIVVDDGSRDATVASVARLVRGWPQLAVITLPHRGKGAAVRQGMLAARGEYVFFADADLSMPIEQIVRFLPPLSPAAEIVIGSREAAGARRFDEPRYRHIMGRVFNTLVRWLVVRGIDDTQCGFKRFTREAAQALCAEQRLNGLSFDVELLALARARGYRIAEIGIDWHHEHHSQVRPIRDTIKMVRDIWAVRRRMRHLAVAPPPGPLPIGDGEGEIARREISVGAAFMTPVGPGSAGILPASGPTPSEMEKASQLPSDMATSADPASVATIGTHHDLFN